MEPKEAAIPYMGDIVTSASSFPNATSTPVITSSGIIIPPPLQSNCEFISTSCKIINKYPAVLKGSNIRTTAVSPTHLNCIPSSKVPPPIPPRGSVSRRNKLDSSSCRGDNGERKRLFHQMNATDLHGLGLLSPILHET
jgi:hypothetical protein